MHASSPSPSPSPPTSPRTVVVVIAGPQASGKSAIATSLTTDLREQGEDVALVELDQIAAMALPTLPDWATAHEIFVMTTGRWACSPLTCVVAEGAGSSDEVATMLDALPLGVDVVTVATSCSFDVAWRRAQADPTRGVSREHDYLSAVYARWPVERERMSPDLHLDTGELTIERACERIRMAMDAARSADRST